MISHYILILATSLILLFSCSKNEKDDKKVDHSNHSEISDTLPNKSKETIYYCPMDTQIVQNQPGTCPICGMDLEPKPHSTHTELIEKDWIYTPANAAVLSTVKSVKPVFKSNPIFIKTTGYITYDETRINNISARIGGRIEKLHIKYIFQPIRKGQALFEIFSHELQTAQQEYLFLKRNDPSATDLLKSAKKKLLLLGMTEQQLTETSNHGHLHATTTVYSPYSGFVIEKEPGQEVAKSENETMNGNSTMNTPAMEKSDSEIKLREGAYVTKGETVFKVVNTDQVWAVFEVHSHQIREIKQGQTIHITLENTNEMIMGKVNFIEPGFKEKTGTTRIRVYLPNKDQNLKIGNLISGTIEAEAKSSLWLPQSSVYDLGNEKIVFVKRKGAFETKKIQTGVRSNNEVEIVSGLTTEDEVAENAQFMIDSESFVKASTK